MLRRLLNAKPLIRANEVHHGLSGLITEKTSVERGGKKVAFDAMRGQAALQTQQPKGNQQRPFKASSKKSPVVQQQ
jgi:hypothetical protein